MNPDVPAMLNAAAAGLNRASQSCTDPAAATDLSSVLGILSGLARDFDGFVASRVAELDGTRRILEQARDVLPDLQPEIRQALDVAQRGNGDLRVSSVEGRLEGLRAALIRVQARLEEEPTAKAGALLHTVWVLQYGTAVERGFVGEWW
jgi:hypothetical protein